MKKILVMDEKNYEAIAKNERMLEKEGRQAWNQREYKTLLLIRDEVM